MNLKQPFAYLWRSINVTEKHGVVVENYSEIPEKALLNTAEVLFRPDLL